MLLKIAGSQAPDMCRLAAAAAEGGLGSESFRPKRRKTSRDTIIISASCESWIRRTDWSQPEISRPETGFHHATTTIFSNANSIWYDDEAALTWNDTT
jgi:hypothetical protein